MARRTAQVSTATGATREQATAAAAKVLVRRALDLGSRDNVTVCLVDLAASPLQPPPALADALARKLEARSKQG